MVVMTAKVSKAKLIAVICILAAIVCVAVLLLRGGSNGAETAENAPANSDITTNERRIAYLAAYGWDVSADPVETQEVMIPEEMNEVYEKYNELQRSQGFDLTRFAGKQVKRYVYQITNYNNATDPVYATLLIYKGSVIGGDVTSTAGEGLMHGFAMPTAAGTTTTPSADSAQSGQSATPDTSDSSSNSTQSAATDSTQNTTSDSTQGSTSDNTQNTTSDGTQDSATSNSNSEESTLESTDDAQDSASSQTEMPAA